MLPFGTRAPRVDPSAWIAPGAVVAGDVEIGPDTSVWFGSVVRPLSDDEVRRQRARAREYVETARAHARRPRARDGR